MLADPLEHFFLDIPPTVREKLSRGASTGATLAGSATAGTPAASNPLAPVMGVGASTNQAKSYVQAHCMQFAEGETDKFFVGSEDFNIY